MLLFHTHVSHLIKSIVFISLSILTVLCHAKNSNYQLDHLANLRHSELEDPQWLQLIPNPNNKDQYYIANKQGQLYLIDDGKLQTSPLLNLAAFSGNNYPDLQLTAIVLHPDFAFREQPGFATFYTAHVTKSDISKKTKRLEKRQTQIPYNHDAVLTEWRLHSVNYNKVAKTSQREILRISLANPNKHIEQLAFNPYKKSWNDNYGLLYLSLASDKQLAKFPLYSGTILRIKPNSFGRKNYTIPTTNPFLKNPDINDEIYLLAAPNIKQFIWPNKNNNNLFINHKLNNQYLFTQTLLHQKTDSTKKNKTLATANYSLSLLKYRGRNLSLLRKRLILLSSTNQEWQLSSMSLGEDNMANTPIEVEWKINSEKISPNNIIKLFYDHNNELIILDQTDKIMYSVNQVDDFSAVLQPESNTGPQIYSSNLLLIVVLLSLISFLIFTRLKPAKKSLSYLVRKNFAHLELSESKKQIGLYRRHKTTTDVVISIADIISSEIQLNDVTINVINLETGHGFTAAHETDLRNYFSLEYKTKMLDDKIRHVKLILTDKKQQTYPISLYVRRGNRRVTKKRYQDVIEDLLTWCWVVAYSINPTGTETVRPKPRIKANQYKDNKWPKREINAKPVAKPSSTSTEPSAEATEELIVDTDLINALEKLVNLKRQGFLTDEEFDHAKHKLLQNLIEL